ncbi:MAG: Ig-like domain-containing protein [Erysipelotrichaceae bacterium]|nr:Ig-like domain-containing protein [Erysipelotrichaceae bacterium]
MKKHFSVFIILLISLLCLSACKPSDSGDKGQTYELGGKTFYNTVDDYGHSDHSKVWFGKDGSFVLNDSYSGGYQDYSGSWTISENVVSLEADSGNKILFEIKDEDTLVLKTTIAGSRSDQIFTADMSQISETDTFSYTVYYNISQSSDQRSSVEILSDGSFIFIDKNDLSISEYSGTYQKNKDQLTLGNFTGVKPGVSEIIFKVKDDKTMILESDVGISATGDIFSSDKNKIPVKKDVPCTGLTSPYHNYWAVEGIKAFSLEVKPVPEDTTDKITYSSDDENVVKVDSEGYVTPIAPGKTKIHVKCGSQTLDLGFETRAKGPKSVELDQDEIYLYLGNTAKIKAKALPETADQTLTYEVSDKSIISVDSDGTIHPKMPGVTKVTVKAKNDVSAVCTVVVEGETVIFSMKDHQVLKEASGEKIPYTATHVMCYEGNVNKSDVTDEVEFHTAYTSALDIDGHGNVYAKGYVYESTDIEVYFTYSDGSSFFVTSPTYIVRVEK